MPDEFDPAPHDKYAEVPKPKPAAHRDDPLADGLKGSFPASDPPSDVQPGRRDGGKAD